MNSRKFAVTVFTLAALASGAVLAQDMGTAATFPPSTEDVYYRTLPAQEQYFAHQQRAASEQAMAVSHESAFPPAAEDVYYRALPAVAEYFDERAMREPELSGAVGGAFPHLSEADALS